MDDLLTALKKEKGELAVGDISQLQEFEDVRVKCHKCGGITIFPVLKDGGRRPTPAPCLHCGEMI